MIRSCCCLLAIITTLTINLPDARAEQPPEPPPQPVSGFIAVGVGFPELLHLQAGYFITNRIALEARVGSVLFNTLVGLGATGYLLGDLEYTSGRLPRHALLTSMEARVNPLQDSFSLRSRGDIIAAAAGVYLGYAFLADGGFHFRFQAGPLLYEDNGFAAGFNLTAGVGTAF